MQTKYINADLGAPVELECGDDQTPYRFGQLIGSVYRQWRKKVNESFKHQGLTDASLMPLVVLLSQGEAMLQKDLAQALSLDSSSLVRVLAQLKLLQLVHWSSDASDRRTKRIALTDKGKAVASEILAKSLEIEQAILAELTLHDLLVTKAALHKIAQRLAIL